MNDQTLKEREEARTKFLEKYDAAVSKGELPTVDEIGWPDGVEPGDFNAVMRLAQEVAFSVRDIDAVDGGAMQWENAQRTEGATREEKIKSAAKTLKPLIPTHFFRHLVAMTLRDDTGARIGLLMLAHMNRVIVPAINKAQSKGSRGLPDGDRRKVFKKQLVAVTLFRQARDQGMGKMEADKWTANASGMTKKQVRTARKIK